VPARNEKYWKLLPETPTSGDDLCRCPDEPPIVLQDHLSSNPLACLVCNGEVSPERIGFPPELAEEIASWRDLHRALFTLELDSSEYESWAQDRLKDPRGRVNVGGLAIVNQLNEYRRAYYWWFTSSDGETPQPVTSCPRCGADLVELASHRVCDTCSILLPHG
jgi:hypothetical protein